MPFFYATLKVSLKEKNLFLDLTEQLLVSLFTARLYICSIEGICDE